MPQLQLRHGATCACEKTNCQHHYHCCAGYSLTGGSPVVVYNKFDVSTSRPTDSHCAVATTSGQWRTSRCSDLHRVVCQSDRLLPGTVSSTVIHGRTITIMKTESSPRECKPLVTLGQWRFEHLQCGGGALGHYLRWGPLSGLQTDICFRKQAIIKANQEPFCSHLGATVGRFLTGGRSRCSPLRTSTALVYGKVVPRN